MAFAPSLWENQSYASYIGPTQLLSTSGTVALIATPLSAGGRYALCCPDATVYIRQGGAGLQVSAADGALLRLGEYLILNVTGTNDTLIAAIGGAGTLRVTRIDSLDGTRHGDPVAHQRWFYRQMLGRTRTVAAGASSARSVELPIGRYELVCPETDVYLAHGGSTVTASSGGFWLPAGRRWQINADGPTTNYLAVMRAAMPWGTLHITRCDQVE